MTARRLLITGSHGLVGRQVVSEAREAGFEIHTLDRRQRALHSEVQHHRVDLLSDDLEAVVSHIHADVVIHLAAQISVVESLKDPKNDQRTNVTGTERLALASARAGARVFIYANSGGAIYDPSAPQPYHEGSPTRPQSPYGLSKLAGETRAHEIAAEHGMAFASLALSNVYGFHCNAPQRPDGVIMRWLVAAASGVPAELRDPQATRDFIHVSDVARAFLATTRITASIDRVNIGSGLATSLADLAAIIDDVTGHRFTYTTTALVSGEIHHSTLDVSRAAEVLSWTPRTTLREGISGMWQDLQSVEGLTS